MLNKDSKDKGKKRIKKIYIKEKKHDSVYKSTLHLRIVSIVPQAPSIPSIQYKPSADCAYSMLVNKITGKPPPPKVPPPLPPEVPVQSVQPPGYFPPYQLTQVRKSKHNFSYLKFHYITFSK